MNVPLHSLQVDSSSTSATHYTASANAHPVKLSANYHVSSSGAQGYGSSSHQMGSNTQQFAQNQEAFSKDHHISNTNDGNIIR